jgi:urease accessory protein
VVANGSVLLSRHFGQDILAAHLQVSASDSRVKLLHVKLYDDFIEAIDGIDNGVQLYPASAGTPAYSSKTDLSSRISYLNPRWNEAVPTNAEEREADGMKRFEKASLLAGTEFFDRVDYTWQAWLPARKIIEDALTSRKEKEGGDSKGRLLIFDEFAAWKVRLTGGVKSLVIMY